MNPRVTAILFAIALVLAAFIFFYELREDGGPSAADPEVRRIFAETPVDPDQVESISLTTEEGTPASVRTNPRPARADRGVPGGIAPAL